jgi:hypothetical protein
MLSERERRVLIQMEIGLLSADRRFVEAMRTGHPRPPREYRRTGTLLLMLLWLVSLIVVLATGNPIAVLAMILASIGGLVRFVSRRLDRA